MPGRFTSSSGFDLVRSQVLVVSVGWREAQAGARSAGVHGPFREPSMLCR